MQLVERSVKFYLKVSSSLITAVFRVLVLLLILSNSKLALQAQSNSCNSSTVPVGCNLTDLYQQITSAVAINTTTPINYWQVAVPTNVADFTSNYCTYLSSQAASGITPLMAAVNNFDSTVIANILACDQNHNLQNQVTNASYQNPNFRALDWALNNLFNLNNQSVAQLTPVQLTALATKQQIASDLVTAMQLASAVPAGSSCLFAEDCGADLTCSCAAGAISTVGWPCCLAKTADGLSCATFDTKATCTLAACTPSGQAPLKGSSCCLVTQVITVGNDGTGQETCVSDLGGICITSNDCVNGFICDNGSCESVYINPSNLHQSLTKTSSPRNISLTSSTGLEKNSLAKLNLNNTNLKSVITSTELVGSAATCIYPTNFTGIGTGRCCIQGSTSSLTSALKYNHCDSSSQCCSGAENGGSDVTMICDGLYRVCMEEAATWGSGVSIEDFETGAGALAGLGLLIYAGKRGWLTQAKDGTVRAFNTLVNRIRQIGRRQNIDFSKWGELGYRGIQGVGDDENRIFIRDSQGRLIAQIITNGVRAQIDSVLRAVNGAKTISEVFKPSQMAAMEESIGTIMSSKVEVELARATIINKISSLEELRVALTSDTIRELVSFAELRLAARGIKGATDNDVGAELGKMFNENVYQGGRVSWDLFEGGNPKVVIAALQADGGGARFFGENGPGTLITKIMSSQRAALVARGKALIEANGGNFAAAQRGWMNGVDIASEDYAAGLAQRLQDLATIVVSDSIAYSGGGDDPVVEPEFDPF